MAGTLALPRVAALAHRLESQLGAGALADALETAADLQGAITQACLAIATRFPTPAASGQARQAPPDERSRPRDAAPSPPADPPPPDDSALERLFKDILAALDQHDRSGAQSRVDQLRERLDAPRLDEIRGSLAEFDFRRAEQLVHTLICDLALSLPE